MRCKQVQEMLIDSTVCVHNAQQLLCSWRGVGGEGISSCFIFTKEKKHVDGGEVGGQVLTDALLYNNEDCSTKPESKCQKKNLGNYDVQSAAAVGRLLLGASCSKRGSKMRQERRAGGWLLLTEKPALYQRGRGHMPRKRGRHWRRPKCHKKQEKATELRKMHEEER